MRRWQIGGWAAFLVGVLLWGWPAELRAQPSDSSVALTELKFYVVGMQIKPTPDKQAVPKELTTTVNAEVVLPTAEVNFADLQPLLPKDLVIKAELRGPAFSRPITLSTLPNVPFTIPTLPIVGIYTLENVRMESGGELIAASPSVVSIESFEKVLVSQVTTRPLTVEEIQQRGVLIDTSNFNVVSFTTGIAVQSGTVQVEFPVLIPKAPTGSDQVVTPSGGDAPNPTVKIPTLETEIPNLQISGFVMDQVAISEEKGVQFPPISGIIVIPGNIGFLHQFFDVTLLVTNGAPAGSGLYVKDLSADIVLPVGEDKTAGTDAAPGDDPLRVAKTSSGGSARTLPVVGAGVDGRLGTTDDVVSFNPGESGQASFTVEGLKEGAFPIDFNITATLVGLPKGPVKISGKASGSVLVRNPNFSITLSHPNTVRAGERYTLYATVTNTSDALANLVSISLDPRGVSGAELLGDSTVQIESVPPHTSAKAAFPLRSKVTGKVTATVFQTDEGIKGKFILRSGVGDNGIPLSPDTLVLPSFTDNLPEDLVTAGVGLLGEAYSIATAPAGALPPNLARIGKGTVEARALNLAEAGLRVSFGEPLVASVENILFDFVGSDVANLPFDQLRRASELARDFQGIAGGILWDERSRIGAIEFQKRLAERTVPRGNQLTVIAGSGTGGAPVKMEVVDAEGEKIDAAGSTIPHADLFSLADPNSSDLPTLLGLITVPVSSRYQVTLAATGAGTVDLGLVLPTGIAGSPLQQVVYSSISILAGDRLFVTVSPTGPNDFLLKIDRGGDGSIDETVAPTTQVSIAEGGPTIQGAVQLFQFEEADKYGRLLAVLFSEKVTAASAQTLENYAVEANEVKLSRLQPSGRFVFLLLRDPIGPALPRNITVSNIADLKGNGMFPNPTTVPIRSTATEPGAVVAGRVLTAQGKPVTGASVRLINFEEDFFGFPKEVTVSQKTVDPEGGYQFDYVIRAFKIEASDPATGDRVSLGTTVGFDGQRINLDLILPGRGTVIGTIRDKNNLPLPGAVVRLTTFNTPTQIVVAANGQGQYIATNVPVGNFRIEGASGDARGQVNGLLSAAGETVTQDLNLFVTTTVTGNITGKVFGADGVMPRIGVPVILSAAGSGVTFAYTDANGSYTFNQVSVGAVSLSSFDQATKERGESASRVEADQTTVINIFYKGLATVTGTVFDAGGTPVSGVLVTAGPGFAYTDAAGHFTLDGIPLGTVSVTGRDPNRRRSGLTTATLSETGQVVTANIFLNPLASIAGTVFARDGVTPVAGAEVRIVVLEGLGLCFCEVAYIHATTDPQGHYRFDDLPLDSKTPLIAIKGTEVGNTPYRLSFDNQVLQADITFIGTGEVTGTVLDAGSNNAPAGANVALTGIQRDEVGRFRYTPVGTTQSDPQTGRFRFTGIYPGNFNVTAFNLFRPIPASANGTLHAAGEIQEVTLVLKPTQGSIAGTVYLPDGKTAAGAGIRVTVQLGGQPITVTTDSQGRYHFSPILPEGGYVLIAEEPVSGIKATASVSVRAGQEVSADLRLLGRGTVVVKVNDAAGQPVPTATVKLRGNGFPYDQATLPLSPSDHGEVTFTNITEGRFSVEAVDPINFGGRADGLLPAEGATITIEARLAPSGRVTGRFLSPDGTTPIGNAQMTLQAYGVSGFVTTSTDPAHLGEYAFEHVPLGAVTVEGFDPVTVRKGRNSGNLTQNGQNLILDVLQVSKGTVKGTVLSGDGLGPVPAATVILSVSGLFSQTFSATSLADGSFSFPGISAGNFSIHVNDPATDLSGDGKGTVVREGEVVDLPVRLQASGSVVGTIYQADGATPAAFAQVTLSSPISRTVQADPGGKYLFKFIPTGALSLKATELNGPDGGLAQGKLSAQGETATVDILFNGAGRIEGTIFESNGTTPAAGIFVRLSVAGAFGTTLSASSDTNGHYTFPRVPSGSFSLTAADPGGLLGGSAGGAIAANGQALTVNLTLQASGVVIGKILKPDGLTIAAGAVATLRGGGFVLAQEANAQGAYDFDGIPLGAVTVDLQDPFGKGIYHLAGSLTQNGQTLDFGTILLDDQAISLSAVDPVDGSVNIPLNSAIQITFSERADLATLAAANIGLFEGSAGVAASMTIVQGGTAVLLQPSAPLKGLTRYTVRVTTGLKDPSGRSLVAAFQSTFMTIDTFPPTIVSLSPQDKVTQVATDSVVRIVLSEAIDPASVTAANFRLTGNGGPIDGRIDLINNQSVLVFTPSTPLSANAGYTLSLSGIKDLAGNILAAPLTATFATIDTIPPTVTGLALAGNPSRILGTAVTVAATVSDLDIAFVDFLADETFIGTDSLPPYTASTLLIPAQGNSVLFKAIPVDRAGNHGPAALLMVNVLQNVPPTIQVGPVPSTVNLGEPLTLSVSGSDDVAVKEITLALSGAIQSTETRTNPFTSVSFTTTFSVPIAANLPIGGSVTATMTVKDSVGNSVFETRTFTIVDTLAPQIRFVEPASGIIVTGEGVDLTVDVSDPGRIASISLSASNGEIVGINPVSVNPAAERATVHWRLVASAAIPIGEQVSLTAQADDLSGNHGTTVAPLILRVVPIPPTLSSITAAAQAGSPADPAKPSANIGQTFSLTGDHLRSDLLVRMTTRLDGGTFSTVDLPLVAGSVAPDGTRASVLLDPTKPLATGPVQWFDPISGLTSPAITLQIVPTIDRFDAPIFSSLQPLTIIGTGLVDGISRIEFAGAAGTIILNDNGPSLVATDANRKLSLLIPIGVIEGPITVVTDGGRSAPFNLRLPQITGLTAVATQGSPADPTKPSANIGQTIMILGTGLRSDLQLRVTTSDDNGLKSTVDLPLLSVVGDGKTAQGVLQSPSMTTGTVRLFDPTQGTGSGSATTLQIVPTVTALIPADFTTGTRVLVSGSGFVENGMTVKLPTGNGGTTSLIDAGSNLDVTDSNQTAAFLMPAGITAGPLTVVTNGGTSNPIAIGQSQPIEITVTPDPINLTVADRRTIQITLSLADFVDNTLALTVGDPSVATLSAPSLVIPAGATQGAVVLTAQANGTTTLTIQSGSITKKVPLFVTSPFGDPVFSIAPSVGVVLASPPAPVLTTIDPVVSPPVGINLQSPVSSTALNFSPVLSSSVGVAKGPAVTGLLPVSGVVGTGRIDLRVIGTNLTEVTSIQLIPNTGLTILDPLLVSADGGSVTVGIAIASNAPTTVRRVVVQTASGIVPPTTAGADLFLVTLPQPEILSITPITKEVGSTFTLTVNGKNLSGATALTFSPPDGLSVGNPPTVDSSGTTATVNVTIGATATLGARVVTVTTPAGTTSAVASPANTFTITQTAGIDFSPVISPPVGVVVTPPATPAITAVDPILSAPVGIAKGAAIIGMTPTSGVIGTSLTLHLLGNALEGVTSVAFVPNTGITVGPFTISADGRDVAVPISVAADAPTTVRTVIIKAGTTTLPVAAAGGNLFLVTLPQPEVYSVTPITKSVGSTFILTLNGKNFSGATAVTFNPPEGISVGNPPTIDSSGTTATVNVTVGTAAVVGPRVVTITAPAGTTTLTALPENTFTVTATPGTDFSSLIAPSVGVMVTPPTSGPATTIFDSVVAPSVGLQFGTAGGGSVTSTFSPIVSPTVGVSFGESMSGITPNVASPGVNNLTLVISGSDLSRVTSVSFVPATGISAVNPPTVAADGKSLTAFITVAGDAPLGARQLKLNTANGTIQPTAAGVNLFTIALPTPEIASMTPTTAAIGSTFTLTVRGRNFSGATTLAFAPAEGISVGNPPLVSLDGTEATVNVSISFLASSGPRLVTLTTPSGTSSNVASPANTFTLIGSGSGRLYWWRQREDLNIGLRFFWAGLGASKNGMTARGRLIPVARFEIPNETKKNWEKSDLRADWIWSLKLMSRQGIRGRPPTG